MFQKPNFKKFRTSEFIQFVSDALTIIDQNYPQKEQITKLLEGLKAVHEKLETSFKRKTKSKLTVVLANLDKRRDNALICINKIADGYLNHFSEEKRKAAQTIVDCIDKYGNRIYALNYQAETSVLSNLGNDFYTIDELILAFETLGLSEEKEEMVSANNLFQEKFIDRIEEVANDDSENATEIIEKATHAYKKLIKLIDAYATISETDEFDVLINRMNSLINRYNYTMALRGNNKTEEAPTAEEMD